MKVSFLFKFVSVHDEVSESLLDAGSGLKRNGSFLIYSLNNVLFSRIFLSTVGIFFLVYTCTPVNIRISRFSHPTPILCTFFSQTGVCDESRTLGVNLNLKVCLLS